MNIGTVRKAPRVVLDTNILISALVYGGKPEQVYNLVLEKQVVAVISNILLSELTEILVKKFHFDQPRIEQLERIIKQHFKVVYPNNNISILRDDDDNRVLEAAGEGLCHYIITGDKALLALKSFEKIKILTPQEFLELSQNL